MVDMWLIHQLFSRLRPGTKVLLVGDADQLESVGAGDVFHELIGSGVVPVTVLDEIFRQAQDSLIAHNARFINEGKTTLPFTRQRARRRLPASSVSFTGSRSPQKESSRWRFYRRSAPRARHRSTA